MPKVGDRRPLEPCAVCGGDQYEEYQAHSAYHNDMAYDWESVRHRTYQIGAGHDPFPCIRALLKRIRKLEAKLR
jgi:hypothetical protein